MLSRISNFPFLCKLLKQYDKYNYHTLIVLHDNINMNTFSPLGVLVGYMQCHIQCISAIHCQMQPSVYQEGTESSTLSMLI